MRHVRLAAMFCLGAAIPCLGWSEGPAKNFQIKGVVVSTRDGSPVPYCRLTAYAIPGSDIGSAPAAKGGPAGRPGGGRNTNPRQGQPSIQNPETTTDASGRFTLEVPRGGGWRLQAEARGFHQQSFDDHDGYFSAVVLSDAEPGYDLTFRLTPNALMTGLVYDEAGEPVESARVIAELIPPPVPGVSSVAQSERPRQVGFGQTDDLGHFELSGLEPGKYRLKVEAQPWYANGMRGMVQLRANPLGGAAPPPPPDPSLDFVYPTTWFPGTDEESAAETIVLGPGEARQSDLHLTAIPAMHLKIPRTDGASEQPPQASNARGRQQQPQQQRQATLVRVSGDGGGFGSMSTSAGPNGQWDFGGLSPGTYEVHLPGPDGRPDGEVREVTVRSGSQTVITLDGAKPLVRVDVAIDGAAADENVTVEFVDTETGRRIQANFPQRGRRGPGGGMVSFDGTEPALRDENADDTGDPPAKTRFAMLPPHEYEVYVSGGGSDYYLIGVAAKGAKAQGRTVTIDGAATVTVKVANGHGRVDGVAKLDGKPVEGAMVLLVPATLGQPGNLSSVQRDETNTDGTFLISQVIPGRYILVAIDGGWSVDWRKPETLAPYLLHGVPVEVKASAKVNEELEAVGR